MSPGSLIAAARTWLGVPYHHQGRSRHAVDCAGLPVCLLSELNALPEGFDSKADYGRRSSAELIAELQKWCVKVDKPRAGCLIGIRWPKHAEVSHLAIYTGTTIIHAYAKAECVVEQNYRGAWEKWTRGYYLLPGVEYE